MAFDLEMVKLIGVFAGIEATVLGVYFGLKNKVNLLEQKIENGLSSDIKEIKIDFKKFIDVEWKNHLDWSGQKVAEIDKRHAEEEGARKKAREILSESKSKKTR